MQSQNQRKASKATRPRKSRPKKKKTSPRLQKQLQLPECTRNYAKALADPFSLSQEVCIPDTHSVPSRKAKFVIRGTGATQANNLGWVFANPFHVANNSLEFLAGVDTAFTGTIAASDGTGVGTAIIMYRNQTTPNGVQDTPLVRAPYAITDYDTGPEGNPQSTTIGAQARVVGAGLRVRYTGTRLNEGGTILIAKRQDGESFDNFTFTSISSIMNTQVRPLGSSWHQVSYTPVQPEDYDYCRNGVFGSDEAITTINQAAVLKATRHHMGFVLKSAAASQPFEWEYVVHVEFLGKIIDNVTRSHSDIVGLSAIRNAMMSQPPDQPQSGPSFFNRLMTSVGNEIVSSVPTLVGAGLALLM